MITLGLALTACFCALAASYFWYRSASVPLMPSWAAGDRPDPMNEPVIKTLSQDGWIAGTAQAIYDSAYWNRRAAIWSAAAVLLTAFSSVGGALHL